MYYIKKVTLPFYFKTRNKTSSIHTNIANFSSITILAKDKIKNALTTQSVFTL